jgi:hypothetical protein
MKEKLELMKWLYENGVEPRMWTGITSHGQDDFENGTSIGSSQVWNSVRHMPCEDTYYSYDLAQPWFPLEQVLEELPLMVHEEKYPRYFEQHKNSNGTTSFYYQYGGVKYLEETSDDYHLAALRLLKKVRRNERFSFTGY